MLACVAPTLEYPRCVVGVGVGVFVVWLQVLKVLEGHTGSVNAVAVSADGSKIVSGSGDKTVRIWSAESGQVPHRSAPCLPLLCVSLLTDDALCCLLVCLCVFLCVFLCLESALLFSFEMGRNIISICLSVWPCG